MKLVPDQNVRNNKNEELDKIKNVHVREKTKLSKKLR